MLFASTVKHAKEILDSLPLDNSRMIGGDVNMAKAEREKLINDFKQQRFKYIVSVGTLTTGLMRLMLTLSLFYAPPNQRHFQQIIGRGLKLHPDKTDCLVLDYAGNIEQHGLQRIYLRLILKRIKKESTVLSVDCPLCGIANEFSARPNTDNLKLIKTVIF